MQQHAGLDDEFAIEHRADGVEHGVDGNVGEKPEPPLVHAHQSHIVRGERACDVEHGAVAPDDDGEVRLLAEFLQRQHRVGAITDMRRRQLIQQHPHLALLQEAA